MASNAGNSGRSKWRQQASMHLDVKGFDTLIPELIRRDRNVGKKAIARATTVGGRILRDVVRPMVKTDSKTLRRSIGYVTRTYRRVQNGQVIAQRVAVVGPRVKGDRYWAMVRRTKGKLFAVTALAKPEKIAHLVAGGAKAHAIRLGKNRIIMHPGFAGDQFMERGTRAAAGRIEREMTIIILDAMNGANVPNTPEATGNGP